MFFGAVGANVGSIFLSNDLNKYENRLQDVKGSWNWSHINWSLSRIAVGAFFSLAISFFLAGTFTNNIYEVLKVYSFTLIVSAFAPKLWLAQEKRILKIIDDRIKQHEES